MSERDEPTLVRVIPVNRRVDFAAGPVVVGSIEIWADGVTVRYTNITPAWVGGEPVRSGGVRLHDGVGTTYVGRVGGGGGHQGVVHFVRSFGPTPPVDISTLHMTVVRDGVEVDIDIPLASAETAGDDRGATSGPNSPELLRVVGIGQRAGFDGGAVIATSLEVWSDSVLVHGVVFPAHPTAREPGTRTRMALSDDRGRACDRLGWGSVGDPGLQYVRARFAPPNPDAASLRLTITPQGRDGAVDIAIPFSR